MTNAYPRESVEFQPVTITLNGATITTGVMLCVVPTGSRPVTWVAPVSLSGQIGVMVSALTRGSWTVWAQITSSPEVPVLDCGCFTVT